MKMRLLYLIVAACSAAFGGGGDVSNEVLVNFMISGEQQIYLMYLTKCA